MRLQPLATALFALLPLTAAAQRADETSAQLPRLVLLDDLLDQGVNGKTVEPRVLPIWTSPDGRILTTVALNGEVSLTPPVPQITSALDWRLANASAVLASELRVGNGQRLRAGVALSEQSLQAASSRQAACFGVPAWLGAMSECDGNTELARVHGGELSAGWSSGPLSIDLAYSLSWLDRGRDSLSLAAIGSSVLPLFNAGAALPTLVLPASRADSFGSGEALGARGRWEIGPSGGIDLGASIGRIRLLPDAEGNRSSYNQTALSLGLDRGAFSGNITGRLLSPQQSSTGVPPRWTSIDLGVTWRTPWQGELSIGAQNLWTTPPPVSGDEAEAQARVPYVQYHQDL